jgi:hypothetical protein
VALRLTKLLNHPNPKQKTIPLTVRKLLTCKRGGKGRKSLGRIVRVMLEMMIVGKRMIILEFWTKRIFL